MSLLCTVVLTFAAASAQQLEPAHDGLSLSSTLERLVESRDADGAVRFQVVAGEEPAQADQFVYSVRFTNTTDRAAEGVRITSPVPPGLRYVDGSAVGPGSIVLFSVDGGLTFGAPSELLAPDEDASFRPADAADFTHVRWILQAPLGAGATGFARFRAVKR